MWFEKDYNPLGKSRIRFPATEQGRQGAANWIWTTSLVSYSRACRMVHNRTIHKDSHYGTAIEFPCDLTKF